MKNIIAVIITFVSFCSFGQSNKALPASFYTNCWANSFEEDNAQLKTKVYRSCANRNFQPANYRQRYIFKNDGTCQVMLENETGAMYYQDCKWTYNQPTGVVTITEDKAIYSAKFEVLSVDDQALKIKSLN